MLLYLKGSIFSAASLLDSRRQFSFSGIIIFFGGAKVHIFLELTKFILPKGEKGVLLQKKLRSS